MDKQPQITIIYVSVDETYIKIELEFENDIFLANLCADNKGIYHLFIGRMYFHDFPSFTISDYYNRNMIRWFCRNFFELFKYNKGAYDE